MADTQSGGPITNTNLSLPVESKELLNPPLEELCQGMFPFSIIK